MRVSMYSGRVPKGSPIINVEGKAGASVFARPLLRPLEQDFTAIQERFEDCAETLEQKHDERLLALLGAMVVEEALDAFFEKFVPGYRLLELGSAPLKQKAKLLRALCLIPDHIGVAAEVVTAVRNAFAHELECDKFDRLPPKHLRLLKRVHSYYYPKSEALPPREAFLHTAEATVIALGVYASHVRGAREYMLSGAFAKIVGEDYCCPS